MANITATLAAAATTALLAALPAAAIDPEPKQQTAAEPAREVGGVLELDWEHLLPTDDRARLPAGPPPAIHDYLGEGGPPARQEMDFEVNQALEGARVRIPGFVVPLDVGKDGRVSEFFLVPYFGACIHVPPPPPNQIVHVTMPGGIALDSIYDAYWITGRMQLQNTSTRLGAAAYALRAEKVEIYKF